MKTQVRVGVWETNSSSVHSLVISGKDQVSAAPIDTVSGGEFGWGYDRLIAPVDKLSYAITAIQYIDQDNEDDISKSHWFKWLQDIVEARTGSGFRLLINSEWNKYGYIDHQSAPFDDFPLEDFWRSDEAEFKEKMSDFIFNSKWKLIIDNDNH